MKRAVAMALLVIPVMMLMNQPVDTGGTIYQFIVDDIDGNPVPLSRFSGRVLLIVNVASKCGFTPQYAGYDGGAM